MLNQFIKLDASDIAGVKSMAKSYKLEDVMSAMQRMWGGESLTEKDAERKNKGGATRAFLATSEPGDLMTEDGSAWASMDPIEDEEDGPDLLDESQAWLDESLEAYMEDPANPEIHANFQDARQKFYREARRSLDKARTSRGFTPWGKVLGSRWGRLLVPDVDYLSAGSACDVERSATRRPSAAREFARPRAAAVAAAAGSASCSRPRPLTPRIPPTTRSRTRAMTRSRSRSFSSPWGRRTRATDPGVSLHHGDPTHCGKQARGRNCLGCLSSWWSREHGTCLCGAEGQQ